MVLYGQDREAVKKLLALATDSGLDVRGGGSGGLPLGFVSALNMGTTTEQSCSASGRTGSSGWVTSPTGRTDSVSSAEISLKTE